MSLEDTLKNFMAQLTGALNTPAAIRFNPFDEENESFDVYLQRFEIYAKLRGLDAETAEVLKQKSEVFIQNLSPKMFQLLANLTTPSKPTEKTYAELIDLLKNNLCPTPGEIFCQDKFIRRIQSDEEKITDFAAELQRLTQNCNFTCPHCKKSIADLYLRTQFIRGVRDTDVREKLLQEKNISFREAEKIATSIEKAKQESTTIINGKNKDTQVNKIMKIKPKFKKPVPKSSKQLKGLKVNRY